MSPCPGDPVNVVNVETCVARRQTKTGPRPVTIKEIAVRAGVSVATISRGLRDDPGIGEATRKRIKELAAKMSYTPSRWGAALSSGRTRCILFIVPYGPSDLHPTNHLYIEVLEGVAEELANFGYSVEIVLEKSLRQRGQSIPEAVTNARAEGVIIVVMNVDDKLMTLKKLPVPAVMVNQAFKSRALDFVVADDRHGAFLATEFLIKHGHRRIAHIGGPQEFHGSRERRAGYMEALSEHGIAFDPKLVRETAITMQDGYAAAESLLSSKAAFTAIFSSQDILSAGIITALRKHNVRVPEDVSIVSFDDDLLASTITPPLTTVRKPRREMGQAAAKVILDRVRSQSASKGKVTELKTTLIERASVTALAGKVPTA